MSLLGLVGLAWLVGLVKPNKAAVAKREEAAGNTAAARHDFVRKGSVLSDGERAFLPSLEHALTLLTAAVGATKPPRLLMHVNLADLVEPKPAYTVRDAHAARNQISQKHVDFVVCNPDTLEPLLVIELDDASHASHKQRTRDDTKDHACKTAGLPLVRVRARAPGATHDPRKLADELHVALDRQGQ